MPAPKLALLIPAYNAASYLPRLLESARRQKYPFDEIQVYDDCSTDETAVVAERYGAKVIRGDINRGCSHGKNRLAAESSWEWIHFHDADDDLMPHFAALCHQWMLKACTDVVLFDYEWREYSSGELLAVRHFDHEQLSADPRRYAILEQINPFCGLYRRSAMLAAGGYDEDPAVLYNEDVAFHIRLAFAGLSFAAESEIAIVNFRRGDSMSASNRVKCARAHYEVMRKTLTLGDAERYREFVSQKLWSVAGVLGSLNDWETADAAIQLAAELAPAGATAGSTWFRCLAAIQPQSALRVREYAIRLLRPKSRPELRCVSTNEEAA